MCTTIYFLRLTYLFVLLSHRCTNTTFYVNLQQLNSVEDQLLYSLIVYFITRVERKSFSIRTEVVCRVKFEARKRLYKK